MTSQSLMLIIDQWRRRSACVCVLCTRDTYRSQIVTILNRSVTTTNNSAEYTIFQFSLLCANSVVRQFVANKKFQRYITILEHLRLWCGDKDNVHRVYVA